MEKAIELLKQHLKGSAICKANLLLINEKKYKSQIDICSKELKDYKDALLILNVVMHRQGTVNLKTIVDIDKRLKELCKLKDEFEEYENSKVIHRKEIDLLNERIKILEWVLN